MIANDQARGNSGARNSALRRVSSPLVAFVDDDAVPSDGWLRGIQQAFLHRPEVVGVGTDVEPEWEGDAPRWFPDEFLWVVGCCYRGLPETSSPVRNVIGASMAFRTDALRGAGGFSPDIGRVGLRPTGCEETELCIRLARANPDGVILHHPVTTVLHRVPAARSTVRYFLARCLLEGRSKARLTSLASSQESLSSERRYVTRTLPSGIAREIVRAPRDPHGLARAVMIIVGALTTAAGYATGRLLRRAGRDELGLS